jgi:1-acyl-sn-glycerol-3-phosphate acyltransferase
MSSFHPTTTLRSVGEWIRGFLTLVFTRVFRVVWFLLDPIFRLPPVLWFLRQVAAITIVGYSTFMLLRRNNTRLHGRPFLRYLRKKTKRGKLIIFCPHRTMFDAYGIGAIIFFPIAFLLPRILPWFMADAQNYKGNRFQRFLALLTRIIPIKVDANGERSDSEALELALELLEAGINVCILPEGGREFPNPFGEPEMRPFKKGVASLALRADGVLIVSTVGMENVQHYWKSYQDRPRMWFDWIGRKLLWLFWCEGKRQFVDIAVSKPITQDELSYVMGDAKGKEARERVKQHLAWVATEKTKFLQRFRARNGRANQLQRP